MYTRPLHVAGQCTQLLLSDWRCFHRKARTQEPAAWAVLLCCNGNKTVQHEPLLKHGQGRGIAQRIGGCWEHLGSPQEDVCLSPSHFPRARGPCEAAKSAQKQVSLTSCFTFESSLIFFKTRRQNSQWSKHARLWHRMPHNKEPFQAILMTAWCLAAEMGEPGFQNLRFSRPHWRSIGPNPQWRQMALLCCSQGRSASWCWVWICLSHLPILTTAALRSLIFSSRAVEMAIKSGMHKAENVCPICRQAREDADSLLICKG